MCLTFERVLKWVVLISWTRIKRKSIQTNIYEKEHDVNFERSNVFIKGLFYNYINHIFKYII